MGKWSLQLRWAWGKRESHRRKHQLTMNLHCPPDSQARRRRRPTPPDYEHNNRAWKRTKHKAWQLIRTTRSNRRKKQSRKTTGTSIYTYTWGSCCSSCRLLRCYCPYHYSYRRRRHSLRRRPQDSNPSKKTNKNKKTRSPPPPQADVSPRLERRRTAAGILELIDFYWSGRWDFSRPLRFGFDAVVEKI